MGMERPLSLETQLAPLAQAPGVEYRTNCQPEKPGKIGQTCRTEGQVAKKVMETSRRVRAMTICTPGSWPLSMLLETVCVYH